MRITRFLLLLFSMLLGVRMVSAQVLEVPLQGNPVLQRVAGVQPVSAPLPHSEEESGRNLVRCVPAGSVDFICPDTTGMGGQVTLTLLDCHNSQLAQVQVEGLCVRYEANALVLDDADLVCVALCRQGGDCDTLFYDIAIHRPRILATEAAVIVPAATDITLCVTPDADLNKPVFQLLGPGSRLTGTVVTLDACFRYRASRFGGLDTVVYRATYSGCLSDTFHFPLRVVADTIAIPFFDDFSYPGPYPDPSKWADDRAFINNHMGYQPPSIGVATLDGVDERGRPYPETTNFRDFLTSAYLDLSGYPESQPLLLSYYIQPRGLGFRPETGDSLILEFKNAAGQWNGIRSFPGYSPFLPGDSIIPFIYYVNGVGAEYRYKGFQFRFRNKSNLTGALDHWHVDYVRLSPAAGANAANEDIAFTDEPDFLLKRYSAMPWAHFRAEPNAWLNTQMPVRLFNHFPNVASANPSEVVIRDQVNNQTLLDNLTLLELPPVVPVNQRDLAPGRHAFVNSLNAPGLVSSLMGLPEGAPGASLEWTYRIEQDQESNIGEPVALRNNQVRRVTHLSDYYAYDDGTAESAIIATKSGTQVALQFRSPVADTLRAVQFHFPRYNVDVTTQSFNLKIWIGSLSGAPVYQDFFLRPFYPDLVFEDSLQAFTTYVLFDDNGQPVGVPVPAGEFFVAWQQGSNVDDPIPVGFDKNQPAAGEFGWLNTSGSWLKFPASLRGALMIRPVMGSNLPTHTPDLVALEDHPLQTSLQVYPNPSREVLRLDAGMVAANWRIRLIHSSGALALDLPWTQALDIRRFPAGWYALQVLDQQGRLLASRTVLKSE